MGNEKDNIMPLFAIKEVEPTFPPGTYEMVLIAVKPKTITPKMGPDAGKELERLEWKWGDPEDEALDITQLTSFATSPKSRINEILVALLGPDNVQIGMEFEEADLIGKKALVTIGLNDAGYSRVDQVTALPTRRTVRQSILPAGPQAAMDEHARAQAALDSAQGNLDI